MGDDLDVVNTARCSFEKESNWTWKDGNVQLGLRDKRLLNFLAREHHTSPFRHCVLKFEVYAPMMVMRQWGKYRVGSTWLFEDSDDPLETWNESSRRYVTEEPVFYIPSEWRSAPQDKKQGSGDLVDIDCASRYHRSLCYRVGDALRSYNNALEAGICAEQARLFLPAYAMYMRARWTVSLQGVLNFLQQRLEHDAQYEIRVYAEAVRDLAQPLFPESFAAFGLGDSNA